MEESLQTLVHDMLYKQILFEYESIQLQEYYINNIAANIFSLKQFPNIEKYNHRGSSALGKEFFLKFSALKFSLDRLLGNDNYIGRFFATRPNSQGFIHIDMAGGKPIPRYWSLNIPVLNCQDNYHEWFNTGVEPDFISTDFNSWFWTKDSNTELINKLELKDPYMLKVSVPHRINNPTDQVRVALAIRTIDNRETFDFL